MSEISLKEYISRLESALNEKAADEVIQHCRHILRSFPKNVTAYRLLGGALLELGRYEEAGAALQRVLSVLPDDYAAHLGLSDAYTGQNRADDAIWHLERAFEQNPNNTKLIDRLRGLYRRFRKGENVKIQMTSAAVARQQVRNRQYEAAITTLRSTLQRTPDRVDLKLLLTRALWETGATLDAAEMAVDVLTVLPNCLDANRLMTELWLSEDRPSDAQPYLNRIEAVDPYLALELVQGETPPDDAFRLNELDYRRAAQKELVDNRPDWLQGISGEIAGGRGVAEPEPTSGWTSALLAGNAAAQQEEDNPLFNDLETAGELFAQTSEPDSDLDSLFGETAAQQEESLDWLNGYSANTPRKPQTDAIGEPSFDSLFEQPGAQQEESLDWLSGYSIDNTAEEDSNQVVFDDPFTTPVKKLGTQSNKLPMSWALNEDEDDPRLGVLGDTSADTESVPDWIQTANEHPDFASAYQEPTLDDAPEEESMDWLRDEIFQDEAKIQLSARQTEPLQTPKTGLPGDDLPVDSDALDWYEDPKSRSSAVSSSSPGLTDMLRGGNFDWIQDEPAAAAPAESSANDTEMDEWLSLFEPDAQPASSPASDWISELEMNDEQKPTSNDLPDWMRDSQPGSEDWLPDLEPAQDTLDEPLAGDVPDWMRELAPEDDESPLADEPIAAQTGELDWMSAIDNVPAATSSDELSWLNAPTDTPLEANDPLAGDVPDWMRELQPEEEDDPFKAPAAVPTATLNWLSEDDDLPEKPAQTDSFSWLDAEPEKAAAPQTDGLSWLNAVDQDDEDPTDEEPLAAGDVPDWMSELNGDTEDEDAVEADMPDWMRELEPEADVISSVTVEETVIETGDLGWLTADAEDDENAPAAVPQTDGLSWLNAVEEDDELPVDEPSPIPGETPDWLVDLSSETEEDEPLQAEEPSIEMGDLSWLEAEVDETVAENAASALQTDSLSWLEAEADEVEAAVPQTDNLSWLDSVEGDDKLPVPAAEPSSIADETPDWMSDLNGDTEEEEPLQADIPDWMSALEPETNEEAEPAASAEAEPAGFEWMTEVEEAEAEVEAEPAAEQDPAWLAAAEKGDFGWLDEVEEPAKPEAQPEASTESGEFEWFTEEEEKQRGAQEMAAMTSTPDWLTALQADDEEETPIAAPISTPASAGEIDWLSGDTSDGEPEEEAALVSETPEWLSELNGETEDKAEPAIVSDTPDWLSELNGDAEPAQEEAIPVDTPDWLSEIRAEDEEPVAAVDAAPVSTPAGTGEIDWLSGDTSDGEPQEEAALVSETPDWLSELNNDTEATEDEEPIAVSETPDWLSDLNSEAEPEEAIAVDTPDWLSEARAEDEITAAPVATPVSEIDWLSESDEEDEALVAADEPDWLTAVDEGGDAEELEAAADEVMGVPSTDEPAALTPDEAEVAQEEDDVLPDWVGAAAAVGGAAALMSDINRSRDEQGFPEEEATFAPTPAENAPDWLNAMVPGIDVDTTAGEAEPEEPEPVAASTGSSRDYNWVIEMAENEQNAEAAAVAPPSGSRFVFTRPPAWLSASRPDDKLPDWPSDDDMPEWLR